MFSVKINKLVCVSSKIRNFYRNAREYSEMSQFRRITHAEWDSLFSVYSGTASY